MIYARISSPTTRDLALVDTGNLDVTLRFTVGWVGDAYGLAWRVQDRDHWTGAIGRPSQGRWELGHYDGTWHSQVTIATPPVLNQVAQVQVVGDIATFSVDDVVVGTLTGQATSATLHGLVSIANSTSPVWGDVRIDGHLRPLAASKVHLEQGIVHRPIAGNLGGRSSQQSDAPQEFMAGPSDQVNATVIPGP